MVYTEFDMGDRSRQKYWPVLKTKQAHLLPFIMTGIGDYICDSNYYTRRHGMEECLLLYTLEGEGIIQYDDREFSLLPGYAVVLDCRRFHYYATKGEEWRFLWIHFAGKCAFDYVDLLNADKAEALFLGRRYALQNEHEKLTSYTFHFNLQAELEISVILQRVMTDLIDLKKRDVFSLKYGDYREKLEESISWLQKHYNQEIMVEQLARICHLSKYYYIKVFKAYTGQTPYDYLVGYRLMQSQQMLLQSNRTVAQIASDCGFGECKNFIACFKNRAGMTPLQYRKYIRPAQNFD